MTMKNKRVQRTRLNGVRNRSRGKSALPEHFLSTLLSMGLVVLLGLFLLWKGGNWLLDELLYQNGFFAIQRIAITTDGVIDTDHYRRWAGVQRGDNLLQIDLARVKRDLESVPWVREAAVKRVLPDTLLIRVQERQAIATLNLPQPLENGEYRRILCQVDETGFISRIPIQYMAQDRKTNPYEGLPHILPYAHSVIREGRLIESRPVQAALQFLLQFNQSPLREYVRLKTIDLSEKHFLRVVTADDTEVILAGDDFPRQVARWYVVHQEAKDRHKMITYLDLSVSNFLPMRWEDENLEPVNHGVSSETPALHSDNV